VVKTNQQLSRQPCTRFQGPLLLGEIKDRFPTQDDVKTIPELKNSGSGHTENNEFWEYVMKSAFLKMLQSIWINQNSYKTPNIRHRSAAMHQIIETSIRLPQSILKATNDAVYYTQHYVIRGFHPLPTDRQTSSWAKQFRNQAILRTSKIPINARLNLDISNRNIKKKSGTF